MGGKMGGKDKGKGKGKGFGKREPEGPPDWVEKVGTATHTCEDQLIVKCEHNRVPQFNARIFLENKEHIGSLDEIFGPINDYSFSIKMCQGMKAESFKPGSTLFIDPMKTLAMDRFLPQKSGAGGKGGKGGKGKGGKGDGKGKGGKGKGKDSKGGKGFGFGKGGKDSKGKGKGKGSVIKSW